MNNKTLRYILIAWLGILSAELILLPLNSSLFLTIFKVDLFKYNIGGVIPLSWILTPPLFYIIYAIYKKRQL